MASEAPEVADAWLPKGPQQQGGPPVPVTERLLRARLESERQRDPIERALMQLVLRGSSFAEGDDRLVTLQAVMRLAARAAPNASSEVLVGLVRPSLDAMQADEPGGAITAEQALVAAETALQAAHRNFESALERGDDAELAEVIVKPLQPHLVYDLGELHRFDTASGLWRVVEAGTLSRLIQSYSGAPIRTGGSLTGELRVNNGRVRGVTKLIGDRVSQPEFFAEAPFGFAFENGWVSVEARGITLAPLLPQHRARAKMKFAFAYEASADRFLSYLNEVFEGDEDKPQKIAFLQEFFGACLMGAATRLQKAAILYGTGRNGKSTLLDVMTELFPPEACEAISPQSLNDPYFRMKLRGVRLNAVAELPRGPLLASEAVKAVISGDAIMGRAIARNPVRFRPVAGHIFAANALPEVADQTPAFWSRFVVIEFKRRFEDASQDKNLARTIIENELPGVALFALQGAMRLAAQGSSAQYTLPASHARLLETWKLAGDSVARFAKEKTVVTHGPSERTRFQPLYESYETWCSEHRLRPVAQNKFGERLRVLGHRPVKPDDYVLYNLKLVDQLASPLPAVVGGAG